MSNAEVVTSNESSISADGSNDLVQQEEGQHSPLLSISPQRNFPPHHIEEEEERETRPTLKQKSRFRVVSTYLLLTSITIVLTIVTPGTKLWDGGLKSERFSGKRQTANLNWECLAELSMVTLCLFVSLFLVQGSDPGYLDIHIMEMVCKADGLSLLGYQEEDKEPTELENTKRALFGTAKTDETKRQVKDVPPFNEYDEEIISPLMNDTNRKKESAHTHQHGLDHPSHLLQSPSKDRPQPPSPRRPPPPPPLHRRRRKFCKTCDFAPPIRSHHCKICNRCVATFDHHCLFIGTCIGERNHCRFYWFISFQLLGFINCVSIVSSSTLSIALSMIPMLAKLFIYPLTLSALIIWCIHSWFALVNATTFEASKGGQYIEYLSGAREFDLPFSLGFDSNLRAFCCLRDSIMASITTCQSEKELNKKQLWVPILWKPPGTIVRDSTDWWENPWQNKYWSCC